MKIIFVLFFIFLVSACTMREKGAELKKGTADYEFASSLAEKVPELLPDENPVIATTNKFEVTLGDVMKKIRIRFGSKAENIKEKQESYIKRLLREMARTIAYMKMTLIEASKAGLVVTDADIDSIINVQYKKSGGKEKFLSILNKNGVTEEEVRQDFKDRTLQKKYIEMKKLEQNPITETEIDSLLNGDRYATVRHIMLLFNSTTDSAKRVVREKMKEIYKKVKAGEDFTTLAKKYSEDPMVQTNGGLLREFERGQMDPNFEKAAFTVPVGKVSGIIETKYGFHILKVVKRRKENRTRAQIIDFLKARRKFDQRKFYDKLKKEYDFQFTALN